MLRLLFVAFICFALVQVLFVFVNVEDHVSRWWLLLVCIDLLDGFKLLVCDFIHGGKDIVHGDVSSMFLFGGNLDLLLFLYFFHWLRSWWWRFDNNWPHQTCKCKMLVGSCCLKSFAFNLLMFNLLCPLLRNLGFQLDFIPCFCSRFSYLFTCGLANFSCLVLVLS